MSGADESGNFAVEVDHSPYLAPDGTRVDAIVSVTGPDRAPDEPPDRVEVLVVDCSGSMTGEKIEQARRATAAAVDALPDGTWFAVVAGTSRATPVHPASGAVRADEQTRAEAVAAVSALRAGGGTRLGVWLDAARAVAERYPDAVRHALLITDGRNAESGVELGEALARCRTVFTCDCRGVGTDWEVEELRTIATALLGTVDIVADAADLSEDLARVLDAAGRRSVPDVVLRLWTPDEARVRAVTQVAPEVRELDVTPCGGGDVAVPLGDWGPETREYHVRVDVPSGVAGDRMLAARIEVRRRTEIRGRGEIVVRRTADPSQLGVDVPRLAHYTAQVELAHAVRDGVAARRGGDDATATVLLGRARSLAERTGHHDTLSLVDGVLDGGRDPVAEMTLDARGPRSLPP